MSKIVHFKDLKNILSSLGYLPDKTQGSHNVYKHPVINSLIVFQGRKPNEPVPEIILSAIIKNIINSNVANEQQILELVEKAGRPFNQNIVQTKKSSVLQSSQATIERRKGINDRMASSLNITANQTAHVATLNKAKVKKT